MGIAIVDGIEVKFDDAEKLNGIELARRAGVEIPHYCWHPGLSVVGSCRMCLVEFGTRDPHTGQISIWPKLTPACNTPIRDGMVLVTQSEKVQQARAMVQEDLLLRHPIDCPICDKAGECLLQDFHFRYGQRERRAPWRAFSSRRRDVGPNITLFVDRCIMCSRCVRFCREISGTAELMIVHRGTHEEIDVLPGFPLNNKLSGNVVDLCPVGALGDKDFLYKQRVWFLKRHPSVCTQCAVGCSIWVEENQDRIWRIKPRENPHVNRWWICNDGRYSYPYVHHPERIVGARRREESGWVPVNWTHLSSEINSFVRSAGSLVGVLSPFLTVEEAYLLAKWIRSIDPRAPLVLGPVPVAGEDERFPGGFVIAAERCPNRRGVEEVVAHFCGRVTPFGELPEVARSHRAKVVWVSGGYPRPWDEAELLAPLGELACDWIVQDMFFAHVYERAKYVIGGAAFAERAGSYVNWNDRLQSVPRAIRPPRGVRPELVLFWELLGREGAPDPNPVRVELAQATAYFAAAIAPVPETGIDLKVNLLAPAGNSLDRSVV